jgi:hypothetical protein
MCWSAVAFGRLFCFGCFSCSESVEFPTLAGWCPRSLALAGRLSVGLWSWCSLQWERQAKPGATAVLVSWFFDD